MSLRTMAIGCYRFFVPKGGFVKNLQAGIKRGKEIDQEQARRISHYDFYKQQKEKQDKLKRRLYK